MKKKWKKWKFNYGQWKKLLKYINYFKSLEEEEEEVEEEEEEKSNKRIEINKTNKSTKEELNEYLKSGSKLTENSSNDMTSEEKEKIIKTKNIKKNDKDIMSLMENESKLCEKIRTQNTIIQNQSNEITQLKSQLENLKKENEQIKQDLLKSNKIISSIQNNQIQADELKKLKVENTNLIYQLNLKVNEINDLKIKFSNNVNEEKKVNYNDIIVVSFISMDSTVHFGVKCLPDEYFYEIEEKLYKKYDNLRETNNMFTANAKPILRFKKISENNIKDGDIIQLFKLE